MTNFVCNLSWTHANLESHSFIVRKRRGIEHELHVFIRSLFRKRSDTYVVSVNIDNLSPQFQLTHITQYYKFVSYCHLCGIMPIMFPQDLLVSHGRINRKKLWRYDTKFQNTNPSKGLASASNIMRLYCTHS